MVATSVGITAKVIKDLKVMNTKESRIIIGAAVIDDIIGMIVLAVVVGMAQSVLDIISIGDSSEGRIFVVAILFCAPRWFPGSTGGGGPDSYPGPVTSTILCSRSP